METVKPSVDVEWTGFESPSIAVVHAVASLTDRTANDLPPIRESIPTDSLDDLLNSSKSDIDIHFTYAGCSIWASSDGGLYVTLSEDQ